MNEQPKLGDVLHSPVSSAQFLVIDPGTAVSMPTIGDVPLVRGRARPCSAAAEPAGQCELQGGRRYVDVARGLTLLCVWPGPGSLRHEGRPLATDAYGPRKVLFRARLAMNEHSVHHLLDERRFPRSADIGHVPDRREDQLHQQAGRRSVA